MKTRPRRHTKDFDIKRNTAERLSAPLFRARRTRGFSSAPAESARLVAGFASKLRRELPIRFHDAAIKNHDGKHAFGTAISATASCILNTSCYPKILLAEGTD